MPFRQGRARNVCGVVWCVCRVCVRACVRVRVRVRVRACACVRACVRVRVRVSCAVRVRLLYEYLHSNIYGIDTCVNVCVCVYVFYVHDYT